MATITKRGLRATLYDSLAYTFRGFRAKKSASDPAPTRGEKVMARMMPLSNTTSGPGTWQYERYQQVMHFRHWVYRCVGFIQSMCVKTNPSAAYAIDPVERFKHATALKAARKAGGVDLVPPRRFVPNTVIRKATPQRPNEDLEYLPQEHALLSVLSDPNGPDTWVSLFEEFIAFLSLTGAGYFWVVDDAAGYPSELWVIPSHWIRPICLQKNRLVDYYEVYPLGLGYGESVRFEPHEIIEIKRTNLVNKLGAQSPLAANSEIIDQYESIQLCRYFSTRNGANIGAVIELPPDTSPPTDDEMERINAKYSSRFGGEQNFQRPMIMPPGGKINRFDSESELAFLQSSDQLRDYVVAQIFGLSKTALGIIEGVNRAAFVAAIAQAVYHVVQPLLGYIAAPLTEHLAARWDDRLRIFWPDMTPADPDSVRADYTGQPGAAVSVNDYRANVLNLEPYPEPEYDRPFAAAGTIPAGGTEDDFGELLADYNKPAKPIEEDTDVREEKTVNRVLDLLNGKANGVH